jgi:uroporphyrinogen-III synthase
MTVMVAREAVEAQRNAADLRKLGVDAHAVAGLFIEPALTPEAAATLAADLPKVHAVMAVSANAVQAFWNPILSGFCHFVGDFVGFDATQNIANQFPNLQHWVTGLHSAQALVGLGAEPNSITQPANAGPQDSEHLWQALQTQRHTWNANTLVWVVRGQDPDGSTGRAWLADRLQAAGVQVQEHTVYRRVLPQYTRAELEFHAASLQRGDTWVVANSMVLKHLCAQLHAQLGFGATQATAAHIRCTHPSIAQAARELGFVRVDDGQLGHSPEAWARSLKLTA